MKKSGLLLSVLLLLSSCDIYPFHSNNGLSSSDSSGSISSDEQISTSEEKGIKIIDFYAVNDLHGRILEDKSDNVPGISKLASYLQEEKKKNEDGYVFINSGDYWQDTYDSGTNKGELLTKCLDVMECEALVLGNHEFDWGTEVITHNKQFANYTSFLGGNIYEYPNTDKLSSLVEQYKVIERDGLKIGIIGMIGEDQITSITSSNWENLTFKKPTSLIKSLSDKLRNDEGCDIVVLSIHADEEYTDPYEITKVSAKSGKRYVDAVFCAHSHQLEIKAYNGVPFIQGGSHGKQVSHVQLTYENGNVRSTYCKNDGYGKISSYQENEEINQIINSYFDEEYMNNKNVVLGEIQSSGGYLSKSVIGRIQAKATYERLIDLGYEDIDIVINNGGRSSVDSGSMTKEKIFNMTPFTNYTYVVSNISGKDIIAECVDYSNPYYWSDPNLKLNENEYYTVACIDYMMLHKNTYRKYNYFSSYKESNVEYILKEYPNEVIENYLLENKTISINQFMSSNYTCISN